MKRTLALALSAVALSVAVCAAGQAQAAQLDPEFGRGGAVYLPKEISDENPTVQLLADGRVLLLGNARTIALLPTGEVDAGFGEGGALKGFYSQILVDPLGRLLAVTARSFPEGAAKGPSGLEVTPSKVLVRRFTRDGQPDPSYGGADGIALSDFGLPPAEPGLPTSVALSWNPKSAAVDAEGRVLISGARVNGVREGKSYGSRYPTYESFLGRFDPDGEVDRGFGDGGTIRVPGVSGGELASDPTSGAAFATFWFNLGRKALVARIGADGQLAPGFGEAGVRTVAASGGRGAESEGNGAGLFIFGFAQGYREHHVQNGFRVKRLLADGKLVRSFGRNGALVFRYPRMVDSRQEVDDRNRIVTAMVLREAEPGPIPVPGGQPVAIALARLRPDGSLDRSFGRRGSFKLPVRLPRSFHIEGFVTHGNDALLSVDYCAKRCGTFLARVDLEA